MAGAGAGAGAGVVGVAGGCACTCACAWDDVGVLGSFGEFGWVDRWMDGTWEEEGRAMNG